MIPKKIAVIDYGVGNILSVQRGLEYCGANVIVSSDPEDILSASKVVLPGVGAFSNGMQALDKLGLIEPILELSNNNVPLLGICLGMQFLLDGSEEFGFHEGLGLIPGKVVRIPNLTTDGETQKIPHIGWNDLFCSRQDAWAGSILQKNREGDAAYFVHSFMALPDDNSDRMAEVLYGGHKIAAVIAKKNVFGCQFHPEKSGPVGLKILRSFVEL
ncbi:imidazole glycerol phosphate synthase subunit HisH [Thalassospira sp. MCCC 1A03138]|uniref:imidazole glycerol phosphate synthase subunit HisH n=1 Tax=Thalassospira sp. MCCC 1A03138 TaxID=1470576 RepID=UPI000A1EB806|nr:imidazole glycerol phosphate synthase subunit HisH [Thalassospira sp. MCCC 1A03138]OSQ27340.1 imidazole glycerol phosphate synthase [Thalassospira sp. MCCC 1A03138]